MSQLTASPLINTRWVFATYAALAGLAGIYLFAWGPVQFPIDIHGEPWAGASLVRIAGGILAAIATLSIPLTLSRDSQMLQTACGWYALAHGILALVLRSQYSTVASTFTPKWAVNVFVCLGGLYLYLWLMPDGRGRLPRPLTTIFGNNSFGESEEPPTKLRSRYEEQIRLAAAQEERHRLARDLHDSVKQQLFVIQTAAATAQERISTDRTGAGEAIQQVRSASREAIAEMQAMLDQLQAQPLENTGLIEALKKQCEAFEFRTGAKVHFEAADLPPQDAIPPGTHDAIFRVAQEALSNAARHARAANLWIKLTTRPDALILSIRDDGSGFQQASTSTGMGLANMRRRADELGGTLTILAKPGQGTAIRLDLPYRKPRTERYGLQAALTGGTVIVMCIGMFWKGKYDFAWFAVFYLVQFAANLSGYLRSRQK